ncbi:hypothetical protein AGOR_G00053440 [Albula goreensis]|uniref:Beta-microseminoprotein-like n=1 Tax=Albula goreensis TaxID=1534307 RepID=A0A8T3DY67_9TELE|nr:hypothetical protein AGOR_G00053440 [Albula goreensis]
MKYLALALLLCAHLHLLHGACFSKMLKPGMTHCQDDVDQTWHVVGSSWRNSACMDCTCTGCCDGFHRPTSIPDDCMMEFDKADCEYKVFKKNDHTQPCPVFRAVGK